MLEQALDRYREKFDDTFPTFAVMDLNETELVELIEQHIQEGKPYEPNYEDDTDY
jgi:hypothetical protein